MKKCQCYIGCICAVIFLFCGCSWKSETERSAEKIQDENITHLVMTYQTIDNSRLDGLDEVLDAVNEISREKIGVEIELKVSSALTQFDDYPLWLNQGITIDLMILNYQNILNYIDQNLIYSLDELLENCGDGIMEIMEESGQNLCSGTIIDGNSYGIRIPAINSGSGCGLWIPKKYLEEIGFPYDEDHIYSMEEQDILFKRLKEKYPEKYPLGLVTSGNTFSAYTYFGSYVESLGSDISTGVLDENGKIVNFYETQQYTEYLEWMNKWYEAGYIYPDAAFTDSFNVELMKAGITMSVPTSSSPGMISEEYIGEEVVCLATKDVYVGVKGTLGAFWVVPKTSTNPEAAMEFLELMYTDEDIINLLAIGIEGRDYVFLDEEAGIVAYPEGKDSSNVEYSNPLGLYGDQRKRYVFDSDKLRKEQEAYEKKVKKIGTEYESFVFSQNSLNVELMKVQEVLTLYLPILDCGCVDIESVYPEFIRELKAAGVDTILEEKQLQFDEWKENVSE